MAFEYSKTFSLTFVFVLTFVLLLTIPITSSYVLHVNATPEDDFDECAGENANDPFCPGAGSGEEGSGSDEETEEEEREREEEEEQDFDECAGENANDPFCPDAGSGEGSGSDEEEDAENSSDTGEDQPTTETSDLLFKHPTYDYSIQYPSNWQKDEDDEEPVSFIAPHRPGDEYSEAVIIGVDKATSLDEYANSMINVLSSSENDFKIVESAEMTVDGNPARKIVFTSTSDDGVKDKQMDIYLVSNGQGYEITYGGVEKEYLDSLTEAQRMIDSFQLTEQATTSVGDAGQDQTTTLPSPLVTPSPAPNSTAVTQSQEELVASQPESGQNMASSGFQTYKNTTLGITMQYPNTVKVTEKGSRVAFTLPSVTPAYVIVSTSELQIPGMPLTQYSNVTIGTLEQNRAGFNLIEQDSILSSLSGNPAHKITFTEEGTQQPQRKTMQAWTLSNGKAFTISYVTDANNFDSNLQTVRQMMDSFQILD